MIKKLFVVVVVVDGLMITTRGLSLYCFIRVLGASFAPSRRQQCAIQSFLSAATQHCPSRAEPRRVASRRRHFNENNK